jgi:predicted TIM-barrel fold metal-dependent hydrolase
LQRRQFISASLSTLLAAPALGAEPFGDIPIIDTHVHLFDGRRPQGAPYKGSAQWEQKSGGVALPSTYRPFAKPLNIVGAIELEASPWVEDNLWVLEQIGADPLFVGTIGDLEPEKPDFVELLDRHRKNPLFLGLRCGNLWGRRLSAQARDRKFLDGLRHVAEAQMVMDTADPSMDLLEGVLRVSDGVPNLRIVLDHLPGFDPAPQEQRAYDGLMREFAARPQIYAKLSGVERRPVHGVAANKQKLDMMLGVFGEDRVLFGSDWPNSWGRATPAEIVSLARGYFATRSRAAAEKFFWKNSLAAYRWHKRAPNQPV